MSLWVDGLGVGTRLTGACEGIIRIIFVPLLRRCLILRKRPDQDFAWELFWKKKFLLVGAR